MSDSFIRDAEKYLGQLHSCKYWLREELSNYQYKDILTLILSIGENLDTEYSDFGLCLNISVKKLINAIKKEKSKQYINDSLCNVIKKLKKESANAKLGSN